MESVMEKFKKGTVILLIALPLCRSCRDDDENHMANRLNGM